jgi:methylthioribose-1-phosphate isomerase
VTLAPAEVIRLEDQAVVLLDQTRLPGERVERECRSVEELVEAIRCLAVRGAPLLGIAGAMGVALAAASAPEHPQGLRQVVRERAELLAAARPTAVNLAWGVHVALAELDRDGLTAAEARGRLQARARGVHADEVARCRAMGAHGAALFADGARILTQCNTGGLATGGYGSALGVVRAVAERGGDPHVWVPETRPLLQGARLTAWECREEGIRHTLVTDNAVGALFAAGAVDGVVVGADRIAANGDTANKIGTFPIAVLAHHHGVPFYVVAPSSTIDPDTPDGAAIPIEQRAAGEVTSFAGAATAPAGTEARNDAFDVTPAALISAIVTERGVLRPPFDLAAERP